MGKLKVTELGYEKEVVNDFVEAGQVRKSNEHDVVLIVDGTEHEDLINSNYTYPKDKFLIINLTSYIERLEFTLDNIKGLSSEEYVLENYPILLKAELTYEEEK